MATKSMEMAVVVIVLQKRDIFAIKEEAVKKTHDMQFAVMESRLK